MKKAVVAILAVMALVAGGFLVWFYVIRSDAPAAFDEGSLDDALSATTTSGGVAPPASLDLSKGIDGTWSIASGSQVGYRVKEVLAGLDTEGAGRTSSVTGSMTVAGTTVSSAEFTVQVATIKSDDNRRDNQFAGNIMQTSRFPTATFRTTRPIDFQDVPAAETAVTVPVTGELTLRGVTREVTFDVEAKISGNRIGVLGDIRIVFADFGIANPSNQLAKVGDEGLLEFVLVFERG